MDREKPSSTALVIATALSLLAAQSKKTGLVTREQQILAEWVVRNYSGLTRSMFPLLKLGWFRSACLSLEHAIVPGIIEHYARRKRALEQLAIQAIERGAGQVVVLGAGFDMLAVRLKMKYPHLRAIEVDHPNTQKWKTRGLEIAGFAAPILIFADLTDPDRLLLLEKYLSAETPVFWVAEGLLMYFAEAKVRLTFGNIGKLSPPGSYFAFTYMQPGEDGCVSFTRRSGLLNRWLAYVREPFAWGIRSEALPAFLKEMNLRYEPIERAIVEEVARLNVGEYLALATVA